MQVPASVPPSHTLDKRIGSEVTNWAETMLSSIPLHTPDKRIGISVDRAGPLCSAGLCFQGFTGMEVACIRWFGPQRGSQGPEPGDEGVDGL